MMDVGYKDAKLEVLKKLRKQLSEIIASEGGEEEMEEGELSETIEDAADEVEGIPSEAPELPESELEDDEKAFAAERRKYFQGSSVMPKKEGSASVIVAAKAPPKVDIAKSIDKAMGPVGKKRGRPRKSK